VWLASCSFVLNTASGGKGNDVYLEERFGLTTSCRYLLNIIMYIYVF
jgi:hypothetical protein